MEKQKIDELDLSGLSSQESLIAYKGILESALTKESIGTSMGFTMIYYHMCSKLRTDCLSRKELTEDDLSEVEDIIVSQLELASGIPESTFRGYLKDFIHRYNTNQPSKADGTKGDKSEDPKTLSLACGMSGLGVNEAAAEVIIEISKKLRKKGDGFNLKDAVQIEQAIEKKYKDAKEEKRQEEISKKKSEEDEFKGINVSIEELGIPESALVPLRKAGCDTLDDLVDLCKRVGHKRLMYFQNLGKIKHKAIIDSVLAATGIDLTKV